MLFRNATLADGERVDVRVDDGEIVAVGDLGGGESPTDDEAVVDATGKHLLPGAIDAHVHFRQPGYGHKETWETGSKSAVAGGVTTVVDQPNTSPPTTTGGAFDEKVAFAADSYVDWGINGGVTEDWDPDSLFERDVFALGEVFLADSTGNMGIDADLFAEAVARAGDAGVTVTVHAEDATLFDESALENAGDGEGRAANADAWSAYRTADAEAAAVERACEVGADADADLHIAHTSTPEGVDVASAAGATCEVSPHHLLLSRADLRGENQLGTYGRMNPPLRSEERREAIYERVADGTVDVVATDHAPHTVAEKEATLLDAPSGVPGVETMLPLLLQEASEGRLDLERVRNLLSANPAAVFDLPAKGRVAEGMDADLVLVDLDDATEIDGDALHSKCGWTPFAGWQGVFPERVYLRGELAYDASADDGGADAREDAFPAGAIGENARE
ncbi:dihydroorotase [Halorubellus sp. JP-L1]|uniref:dihydroorotase n=1 Tax=Halorubellus sp. JP-L1 TaxID=2715753 RepID=UPI00140A2F9F|nr:dihydroorotase [Halorubellus sp. JP-L1]NHN41585.1 dihydroorotase [Halorubellus sp. JP-L1]